MSYGIAVEPGHLYIQDRDIRLELSCTCDALKSICRFSDHGKTGLVLKSPTHRLPHCSGVIDDQDTIRWNVCQHDHRPSAYALRDVSYAPSSVSTSIVQ